VTAGVRSAAILASETLTEDIMEFFNFGNQETYHFFKWLTDSDPDWPEALINDAFRRAETTEDIPGDDICFTVRDRLGEKLQEVLYEIAPDLDPECGAGVQIGEIYRDQGERSAEALLNPISSLALCRIDCETAAVALLIRAGKWNPPKEPPEII
jgi:hypothetical protein